jgi:PAS domain S-box-containing protein
VHYNLYDSKILVVDDHEPNVEVLLALLEMKGYTNVRATTDSREVLGLINSFEPDLVLLDLMMPHMSGFDILAALRASGKLNGLMPIMVLTADANIDSKQRALSEGASDFLTKPFAMFEVDLRIRNLLSSVYLLRQQQIQNNDLELLVSQRTASLEKVKNEIQTSEIKYRVLFEANFDSITVCELNEAEGMSKIVDCNDGALRMFGYSKEELLQMQMCHIEVTDTAAHSNKIAALQQKGSLSYETNFLNKDGEIRYMEVKVVRINLYNRVFAMHIASDTTERNAHLQALESQNQALKDIAWHQSHVIRAPLARLLAITEQLLDANPAADQELFTQYLGWMQDSAKELDGVIRVIADKIEASQFKF